MTDHVLVKCRRCDEFVWCDTAVELPVREETSEVIFGWYFCPTCNDEIEARSRHQIRATYST